MTCLSKAYFYLSRISTLPHQIIAKKVITKILHIAKKLYKRQFDIYNATFLGKAIDQQMLHRNFSKADATIIAPLSEILKVVSANYLNHHFDLLGSGWVKVEYGMRCRGLEDFHFDQQEKISVDEQGNWLEGRINKANLEISKQVWRLIDVDYMPIDWQIDFKSGYRWEERTWYQDIVHAHKVGVDIKMPWELARMQHLPQLAWRYGADQLENDSSAEIYCREFRNQVLDFIATNPPRFGVNWVCTMDVGIRVANWLVAYDLFCAFEAFFDADFEQVFKQSIYEHGKHIINNLEWTKEFAGNHYLANIVGLLFVSAYLPQSAKTNTWLAFSVQELINTVKTQFHEEGSNFEASTSYHRLSSELVVYATALVLALPEHKKKALLDYDNSLLAVTPVLKPAPITFYSVNSVTSPFPEWYVERLEKMAEFTMDVTRPDGLIAQIGDNDSGRFLKLFPNYIRLNLVEVQDRFLNLSNYSLENQAGEYWLEQGLDHRHIVAAINVLFDRSDFSKFAGSAAIETVFIKQWIAGKSFKPRYKSNKKKECVSYPEFGLYIYRTKRFYLLVRCGSVGQNGKGGHAHNDQLSFELCVDGKPFFVDPGTYVYTPLPNKRNFFRSTGYHNTLSVKGSEQNTFFPMRLFMMMEKTFAKVINYNESEIEMQHVGFGKAHQRKIKIKPSSDSISVQDSYLGMESFSINFTLAPSVEVEVEGDCILLNQEGTQVRLNNITSEWRVEMGGFSAGYGMIEDAKVLRLLNTRNNNLSISF